MNRPASRTAATRPARLRHLPLCALLGISLNASADGSIRLNWRLIHLPPALIDYVVAHEVAHLVEMNHSPRFWAVVERLYPDWRGARAALRKAAAALPVIAAAPATDTGVFEQED